MLVLGHVLCTVPPDGDWAARLEAAGWRLGEGTRHLGQGTRNRRLVWAERYLEWAVGPHRLELTVDRGAPVDVSEMLSLLPR